MAEGPQTETIAAVPTGPTEDYASYIGGSKIAALAGVSPYKTALDVWAEMKGLSKFTGNARTRLGNKLERPILELYAEERGYVLSFPGTILRADAPFLGATPDAIVNAERNAQVKCVGRGQFARWGDPDDGADAIPPEVHLQTIWEVAIIRARLSLEIEVSDVVALMGTDLNVYAVPFDPDVAAQLEVLARAFWERHVVEDVMPSVEDTVDARRYLEARFPKPMRALLASPWGADDLARRYDAARAQVAEAEKLRDMLGSQICGLIGDAEGFAGDWGKATWKLEKGRPNYKAIAEALGVTKETLQAFTSPEHRVLRVTLKKGE